MAQRLLKKVLFIGLVVLLAFSSNCWMKKMVMRHLAPQKTASTAAHLPINQQKSAQNINTAKTCQVCTHQENYLSQTQDAFKTPLLLFAATLVFTFLLRNILRANKRGLFQLARSPLPDKLPAYLRYRHLLLYH